MCCHLNSASVPLSAVQVSNRLFVCVTLWERSVSLVYCLFYAFIFSEMPRDNYECCDCFKTGRLDDNVRTRKWTHWHPNRAYKESLWSLTLIKQNNIYIKEKQFFRTRILFSYLKLMLNFVFALWGEPLPFILLSVL